MALEHLLDPGTSRAVVRMPVAPGRGSRRVAVALQSSRHQRSIVSVLVVAQAATVSTVDACADDNNNVFDIIFTATRSTAAYWLAFLHVVTRAATRTHLGIGVGQITNPTASVPSTCSTSRTWFRLKVVNEDKLNRLSIPSQHPSATSTRQVSSQCPGRPRKTKRGSFRPLTTMMRARGRA